MGPGAAPAPVEVVLFDLGGVLMEFDGVAAMRRLSGLGSDAEVWDRWLDCRWVRTFESGACGPEEFAAGVVADWGLAVTPGDYLAQFRSWAAGPAPGAVALVRSVRRQRPVGCLSNTNVVHWAGAGGGPLVGEFDHVFLSFELGRCKPDPLVFGDVLARLSVDPDRVLFLDDNERNVVAARAAGMRSEVARGVAGARDVLSAAGIACGEDGA